MVVGGRVEVSGWGVMEGGGGRGWWLRGGDGVVGRGRKGDGVVCGVRWGGPKGGPTT